MSATADDISENYRECALECFKILKEIHRSKPKGKHSVQLVVPNTEDQVLFAGISGLFRTATLENTRISEQIILTDKNSSEANIISQLKENSFHTNDRIVKYEDQKRYTFQWQEKKLVENAGNIPFKDNGV